MSRSERSVGAQPVEAAVPIVYSLRGRLIVGRLLAKLRIDANECDCEQAWNHRQHDPNKEVLVADDEEMMEEEVQKVTRQRRSLNNFWGKFKDGIIDLFKEEEDKKL